MDALKGTPFDEQGRASVSVQACHIRPHKGKRFHDTLHGTFPDGFVTGQCHIKFLGTENPGYKACGGAAVAAVQHVLRLFKTVKAIAPDQDMVTVLLNDNAHFLKAGNGREAVRTLEEIVDFRGAFCNGAKHDGPVGDGFIPRNRDLSVKPM